MARKRRVVPIRPPEPPDRAETDFLVRIAGRVLKVDVTAKVTDITGAPKAPVVPIRDTKP